MAFMANFNSHLNVFQDIIRYFIIHNVCVFQNIFIDWWNYINVNVLMTKLIWVVARHYMQASLAKLSLFK